MTKDVELEVDVLAMCLRDAGYVRRARPVLKANEFSMPQYAWVWKTIQRCVAEFGELPSVPQWKAALESEYKSDDDRAYAGEVLVTLIQCEPMAPKASLEQLRTYVRMAAIRRAAGETLRASERGDVDRAVAEYLRGAHFQRDLDGQDEWTSHASTLERRLKAYTTPDTTPRIPTPWASVDEWTYGGLKTRRSHNIAECLANTNVGKTALMTDIGVTALMARKDLLLLHGTTEETGGEAEQRYDARFVGISRTPMSRGTMSDAEVERMLAKYAANKGVMDRLFIREFPPGTPIESYRSAVEIFREEHPDGVILSVLDMADHFSGKEYAKRHEQIESVYWVLKAMAMDPTLEPFSLWLTGHAKAEAARKKSLTAEDQGGAYAKSQIVDLMFAIRETDHEAAAVGSKVIEALLAKNRLGPVKHRRLYLEADMDLCRFEERAVEGDEGKGN